MSLARGRGRRAAIATAALGIAVVVAVAIAGKDAALEWWYLRQLREGDAEERLRAAEALGEMRSARAAPLLVAEMTRIVRANFDGWARRQAGGFIILTGSPGRFRGERGERVQAAILKVGKAAEPALIRAWTGGIKGGLREFVAGAVALTTLFRLDPELWEEPFHPRSRNRERTEDGDRPQDPPEAAVPEPTMNIALRRIESDEAQSPDLRRAARDALAALETR